MEINKTNWQLWFDALDNRLIIAIKKKQLKDNAILRTALVKLYGVLGPTRAQVTPSMIHEVAP